jgi:hypothetical protein
MDAIVNWISFAFFAALQRFLRPYSNAGMKKAAGFRQRLGIVGVDRGGGALSGCAHFDALGFDDLQCFASHFDLLRFHDLNRLCQHHDALSFDHWQHGLIGFVLQHIEARYAEGGVGCNDCGGDESCGGFGREHDRLLGVCFGCLLKNVFNME